jgi:phage shock protein PspC (stress-responsive transcriptional regulator)
MVLIASRLLKVTFNNKYMTNKLYRGGGYIGGVCQGLGKWSGLPSILWRLIFLLTPIPSAFLIYIILWIFLSKES